MRGTGRRGGGGISGSSVAGGQVSVVISVDHGTSSVPSAFCKGSSGEQIDCRAARFDSQRVP